MSTQPNHCWNEGHSAGLLFLRARRLGALLLGGIGLAGSAFAQTVGSMPADDVAERYESGVVLARFTPVVRGAMTDALAARHHLAVELRDPTLDYVRLRVAPGSTVEQAVAGLRLEGTVVWATPSYYYYVSALHDAPQDSMLVPLEDALPPAGRNQWGLFRTGIPWLWRQGGAPGSGVTIAIVDSGLDHFTSPHPDLAANIEAVGKDFVDGDTDPTDVGPHRGHGTHVAGIAAMVSNERGGAGVAYGARLMIVRVMDCAAGSGCPGTVPAIASGIRYAADHGARVINLSLGSRDPQPLLREAVQYAMGKGSIVVAAAGNDSSLTTVNYPAGYEEVIAVGASDSLDHVPIFSTSGPTLDLVAPGTRIWSTYLGGGYRRLTGTSMASPLVAGVAAIVAGRNPGIKQREMQGYLRAHALPLAGADAERDGAGRVNFPTLEDWDDLPPPYVAARHRNFLWEWLGRDASGELSFADPVADTDFRPNIGAPGNADGYDDGVLPETYAHLPFLPPHLGAPTSTLALTLAVSRHDGPRYGADPSHSLHTDVWIDWDSDHAFEEGAAAAEHVIVDHPENPATWSGDSKALALTFVPVDGHILGNPLAVRTRLNYGTGLADAGAEARFGEVEDISFVNFLEDFDLNHRPHDPGVYTITDSWGIATDPTGPIHHHGDGSFARSTHPAIGAPCNGFIERINVMATPMMNWQEYTRASLRFWYCHQATPCGGGPDRCRIRIDANGVKTDLGPIPIGIGTMDVDLSAFVGHDVVIIEFVEETDQAGIVCIDDVQVVAYDDDRPSVASSFAAIATPGAARADLAWYAPRDNQNAPSPPTEQRAHLYDVRLATTPIASEASWEQALRLAPSDVAFGAGFVPGTSGVEQAVTLTLPSAFQNYNFSLRTMDEVTQSSALSSSPGITAAPTLGVQVDAEAAGAAAPGDTAHVPFRVSNTGDTTDTYALSASDSQGWELVNAPGALDLDPGGEQLFDLLVLVPTGAGGGQADSVVLRATSLSDPAVTQSAGSLLAVDDGTVAVGEGTGVGIDDLRVSSANPAGDTVGLTLEVHARSAVQLRVISPDGRVVRRIFEGEATPGRHLISWNTRDDFSRPVASGTYFLEARFGSTRIARRLVVLR